MKVIILDSIRPFEYGLATRFARNLVAALINSGHDAELIKIPFRRDIKERFCEEMIACKLMTLYGAERVIGLRFPSALIPHESKVLWWDRLPSGELFGQSISSSDDGIQSLHSRVMVEEAEREIVKQSRSVFTTSEHLSSEIVDRYKIDCQTLLPPWEVSGSQGQGIYEDYLVCPDELVPGSRHMLILEAFRCVDRQIKLVFTGESTSSDYADEVRRRIKEFDLEDRVRIDERNLCQGGVDLTLQHALAVVSISAENDPYGFNTSAAFQADKALITTCDSPAVANRIRSGVNGWVCDPTVNDLVIAFERVAKDRPGCEELGRSAGAAWRSIGVRWDSTIERLLS